MDPSRESSASQRPSQQRKMKLALLLVSIAFSAIAFLALDWVRSAAIVRHARSQRLRGILAGYVTQMRITSLKPNCAPMERWGGDT